MTRGINKKSLANLQPGGEPRYEQPKRQRNVSLTDTGWQGLKEIALDSGLSLAELLEQIGRRKIKVDSDMT